MRAWLLTSPWPKPHFYETWRFLAEMKNRGLDAVHVNPDMCTFINNNFYINGEKVDQLPKLVFMRHAVWNTNGLMKLAPLREKGVIFVTDIEPHIEALDKIASHPKYLKANIPMPKTIFINAADEKSYSEIGNKLGWPCVVKWRFAAGSEKVFLCHDEFEMYTIASEIFKTKNTERYDRRFYNPKNDQNRGNLILVQEYIDLDYMITAHAVKDTNIQCTMQAIPPYFTGYSKFKANFANAEGRVQLPIKANSEIIDIVNRSLEALDIEWGRVDIFPTKDGFKLCEVNPSANFPMTEACSLQNLAAHMIDRGLKVYSSKR